MARREGPGLSSTGNRVLLAVVLALVVYVATQTVWLAAVIGVVVYLLATLVSRARK
jgi:type IV secretory pathway TrbD component